MKRFKKADLLIILAYIGAIVISFSLFSSLKSDYMTVSYENHYYTYPLDKDNVYAIQGELGITEIEVKDGKFRFISSPCPGKTCIYQGYSDMIVCLPNKVIATSGEGELDAISR